ncbi:MAG: glycosyltransferase [Caulobacteraceae bacterium]|nr:glycosyltransferase [Caulobacteraceae bacterium]
MNGAPDVSVIMASFNGAAYLAEAIGSVQRQTLASWELIVVDDASSDDSVAVARALAAGDPRIRIFQQPANRGPAAARNRALDEARGGWIAVFDCDDAMAPDRLERLLARARDDGAQIVADNQVICSSSLQPERTLLPSASVAELRTVGLARFIQSGCLYSTSPDLGFLKPLICAALIDRAGARYDEGLRIAEDFHFLLRLLRLGKQIHIEPEPLYFYRKHAGSISHRLSQEVIASMIAADEGFRTSGAPLSKAARQALDRRIRGLRSWSVHERAMQAWKAGRIGEALAAALSRPHAWPLMSQPVRARIGRCWQAARAAVAHRGPVEEGKPMSAGGPA